MLSDRTLAAPAGLHGRVPFALMYHSVTAYSSDPYAVTVTPETFAHQMAWLRRCGLRGVSMRDLLAATAAGRRGGRLVGLTFDDGYADFLTDALPVLRRYGFGATVFALAGKLGGRNDWDLEGPVKFLLGADQLREIAAAGIEIGSHGLGPPPAGRGHRDRAVAGAGPEPDNPGDGAGPTGPGVLLPVRGAERRHHGRGRRHGYGYAVAIRSTGRRDRYALPRTYVGEADTGPRLLAKLIRHRIAWRGTGPDDSGASYHRENLTFLNLFVGPVGENCGRTHVVHCEPSTRFARRWPHAGEAARAGRSGRRCGHAPGARAAPQGGAGDAGAEPGRRGQRRPARRRGVERHGPARRREHSAEPRLPPAPGARQPDRHRLPAARYVLDLDGEATDVELAEHHIEQGTRAADPATAVAHLRDALALWRGRPLADVTELPFLDEQATRLDGLWLRAKLALVDAMLALGEHDQVVRDLEQLAEDHPFDERIHGQLMVALYRSGRQADALGVLHDLRGRLDTELGIDVGKGLRDLETAILRQDATLSAPLPAPATARRRYRPNCRWRSACSSDGPSICPPWTNCSPQWTHRGSRSCPAPPGWARRRWPCTGRTGSRTGSRTASST
jgi:hypothetical protein